MQDRIASLNGRTVQLVIRQDRPAFIRLIGISVLQSAASAVLAPSLRHVADALAMTWRRRLTAAAHSRYFRGNTFYTTSQLAGQLLCHLPRFPFVCKEWIAESGMAIRKGINGGFFHLHHERIKV